LFEQETGDWVVQLSKGSEAHIEKLGGKIIAGTAEEVDQALIDDQGRYLPRQSN
jgi:hypothetical protein